MTGLLRANPAFVLNKARFPVWKRLLDAGCILIAVPLLGPAMLAIALVIKLTSKGPVLFKQQRIGLFGKRFIMLKFRTMVTGADTTIHEEYLAELIENNKVMTKLDMRGDSRLTKIGRLLRTCYLDELPQLFNVLRGEISLVGPRPCTPSEYKRYLPWQRERFLCPPGLTGLWQVSGKNCTTFNEMVDLDIKYVRNNSLLSDLGILVRTIPLLISELRGN